MARYTDAVCKLCRREEMKLFLKGERCFTEKCAYEKRPFSPGDKSKRGGRRQVSNYGQQLRQKQKVKRIYGVLERQFRNYFARADRMKGVTGENLLRLLEMRLDNVVFRMGMAPSRKAARQMVRHRHIAVNGRTVDIPSYQVRVGDEVAVRERDRSRQSQYVAAGRAVKGLGTTPDWVTQMDAKTFAGRVMSEPRRDHVDLAIEEHLIVELYSK